MHINYGKYVREISREKQQEEYTRAISTLKQLSEHYLSPGEAEKLLTDLGSLAAAARELPERELMLAQCLGSSLDSAHYPRIRQALLNFGRGLYCCG